MTIGQSQVNEPKLKAPTLTLLTKAVAQTTFGSIGSRVVQDLFEGGRKSRKQAMLVCNPEIIHIGKVSS